MFSVKPSPHNPILRPVRQHNWEKVAATNASPIQIGDTLHLLYRAIGNPDRMVAPDLFRSTIGHAMSHDGVHFENRKVLVEPEEEWEKFGCEDPRVTKMDGKYYIFYTGISDPHPGKDSIKVAVAITKDFKKIEERHLVTPFNAKAMALFPEKVNGKYTVIVTVNTDNPPSHIAIAQADKLEDFWNEEFWNTWYTNYTDHAIELRQAEFDHVEVGAVPVKTEAGWVLIYSRMLHYYADRQTIFGINAALLDLEDPLSVIGQTAYPIIVPDSNYAKYGFVGNVVFPTGAHLEGDVLEVYFGAADTTTCRSVLSVSALIDEMRSETRTSVFTRATHNPILKPNENKWEERDVFNPAAIDLDGKVHILYRAMSMDNTSTIGYATSSDGVTIDYRHPEPIYVPREDFEMKKNGPTGNSGCEDPRLTKIGKKIFMCYTAYNGVDVPQVALTEISERDFLKQRWDTWSKPILVTPRGVDDKDACLFPQKIKGKYWFVHRIASHVCVDQVDDLNFTPSEIDTCLEILEPRPGMWDGLKVGLAGPPHLTHAGWLFFYHGVSEDKVYRMGAALLDAKDPTNILGRTALPMFEPEEEWEIHGEIGNVVFPCGSVIRGDTIYLYYGGADKVVGVATGSLRKVLELLQ